MILNKQIFRYRNKIRPDYIICSIQNACQLINYKWLTMLNIISCKLCDTTDNSSDTTGIDFPNLCRISLTLWMSPLFSLFKPPFLSVVNTTYLD